MANFAMSALTVAGTEIITSAGYASPISAEFTFISAQAFTTISGRATHFLVSSLEFSNPIASAASANAQIGISAVPATAAGYLPVVVDGVDYVLVLYNKKS